MSNLIKYFEEERAKFVKASEDFLEFIKTHSKEENIEYANRIRKEFHYIWTLNTYHDDVASKIKDGMVDLLLEYKYYVEGKKY